MNEYSWKSAEDLMRELESDPDFLRRRATRQEKFQKMREQYADSERPVLESLSSLGFDAESIEELVRKHSPLPIEIVQVLLDALVQCVDVRVCESYVRALAATKERFDGRTLVTCFDSSTDEGLRWAILNTIALTKPLFIDDWLIEASSNPVIASTLRELASDE